MAVEIPTTKHRIKIVPLGLVYAVADFRLEHKTYHYPRYVGDNGGKPPREGITGVFNMILTTDQYKDFRASNVRGKRYLFLVKGETLKARLHGVKVCEITTSDNGNLPLGHLGVSVKIKVGKVDVV